MRSRKTITYKMLASLLVMIAYLVTGAAYAQQSNTKTTVTYFLTDAQGNVLATTDAQGNITARYTYRPYGTQQTGPTNADPGYTGHVNDPDTGLIYMQQRYYDPDIKRFISPDPIKPMAGNVFNFGRYTYANDNPTRYTDPDGRQSFPGDHPLRQALLTTAAVKELGEPTVLKVRSQVTIDGLKKDTPFAAVVVGAFVGADEAASLGALLRTGVRIIARKAVKTGEIEGKSNGLGTIHVDSKGNALPTPKGGTITGSSDGRYIQVRDADGKLTGARIDGPHKPATHPDPRAQQPHAHVPDVKNPDGTPWLPINY